MTNEQKPLAQMSLEELAELWVNDNLSNFLHALIRRATREAREGMMDEKLALHWQKAARDAREQRNEARTQLAEAERKLATARVEGARKAFVEGAAWARGFSAGIVTHGAKELAERRYPAPTPAAGGTPDGVRGDIARATERMTRIAQVSRKLAETTQLSDDHTAAEDFECAKAALVALAREAR